MKKAALLLMTCFFTSSLSAQSQYIGLRNQANFTTGQSGVLGQGYWPDFQIIDSIIYVPTFSGIYRKSLSSITDTSWSLYAFGGVQISDFKKRGSQVLAITNKANDSLLLYSNDDGQSYVFRDSSHFIVPGLFNTIYRVAHNTKRLDTVLVAHHYGISISLDTGRTWSQLSSFTPEYQYRFIDFHPRDPLKLYSTGEGGFFSSYVYGSNDGGNTWGMVFSDQNDCVHTIAFHPTRDQEMLLGREGKISRTIDGGGTWATENITPYLYIYKIKYDNTIPDLVYAAGGLNGFNDTVYFLKSTNGGDSWSIFYRENLGLGNAGPVLDFEVLGNQIIYYVGFEGLFITEINSLHTYEFELNDNIRLYPNPFSSKLNIEIDKGCDIESIRVFNSSGALVYNASKAEGFNRIDLSNLEKGVYFVTLVAEGRSYHKKVIKE